MQKIRSAVFLLALLNGGAAFADEACEQGRQDVAEALQHARLDDYTKRQVDGELSRLEKARSEKSDAVCEDAVGKLKHILHLDH